MPRKVRQKTQTDSNSSSSDSESNSDSDNSLERPTASDVINSFLNPLNGTVQQVNTLKSRKASDVINSFLQKKKFVDPVNHSEFRSALDVINSYLRKDKFVRNGMHSGTSVPPQRRRKSSEDSTSTSESDSDLVSGKRRREIIESSSTSDSDSCSETANRNFAKRRRIEPTGKIRNESSPCQTNLTPVEETAALATNAISNDIFTANNSDQLGHQVTVGESHENNKDDPLNGSGLNEESQESTAVKRTTPRKKSSNKNGSLNNTNEPNSNVKSKRCPPEKVKISFTREIVNRKMRTKKIVEQQTTIKNSQIPKEKYDRALAMLNATECFYDETPVDYSLPKTTFDVRRSCHSRRHAEATYDTVKLGISQPISLTRIVIELDNCMKKENWQQMAELIYFGCGLMKTEQTRRAIGTAFFTYALLLLILDSTRDTNSTMDCKRNEIMKFLVALGSEQEESEELLNELNLAMDESDTTNGLLVIKSEDE